MKNYITKIFRTLFALGAATILLVGSVAQAEELTQVDGTTWKKIPNVAKQAYLVGINNLLDAEYAYQMKGTKNTPKSSQTLIQRMYLASNHDTIGHVVKVVDNWYKSHPDELDKAVLEVLWITYVEKKS